MHPVPYTTLFEDPGIILLDKQIDISSAAALSKVKRKLGIKKIGHAGTLDPGATGLLVCLLNKATRLASHAEKGRKRYTGTILFGLKTDTDDIAGTVTFRSDKMPTLEEIKEHLPAFTGTISQVPPDVSAVKVEGQRSYELARAGREVELEPRQIEVYSFKVREFKEKQLSFEVECSRGTYIRALARDLGDKLGCGACLADLTREASVPYFLSQAHKFEDLTRDHILGVETLFPESIKVELDPGDAAELKNGEQSRIQEIMSAFACGQNTTGDLCAFYVEKSNPDRLCGFLERKGGVWKIAVNF